MRGPSETVLRGRRAADALLVDTCVITRQTGEPTLNTSTGVLTFPTPTTIHWDLPCRVRPPSSVEMTALFGDTQVTTLRYVLCVPAGTTGVAIDDIAEVTPYERYGVASRYRVVAVPTMTFELYVPLGVEVTS